MQVKERYSGGLFALKLTSKQLPTVFGAVLFLGNAK